MTTGAPGSKLQSVTSGVRTSAAAGGPAGPCKLQSVTRKDPAAPDRGETAG